MTDDAPKYLDHDFPLPYKTIPDGIMILSSNNDTDIFVDDDIIKAENLISVGLSKFEEEAKSIKNHDQGNKICKHLCQFDCTVHGCFRMEFQFAHAHAWKSLSPGRQDVCHIVAFSIVKMY